MRELATQTLSADSGLRAVYAAELLQADRKIWYEIASVRSEGWTLDQALREITKIQSDLPALLQPRAKPAGIAKGKPLKKGDGKGLPTGPRLTVTKDTASPQLSAALQNLATKQSNKTLCLRYNRGACANKQRKFAHLCGIKVRTWGKCVGNDTQRTRTVSSSLRAKVQSLPHPHPRQPPETVRRTLPDQSSRTGPRSSVAVPSRHRPA